MIASYNVHQCVGLDGRRSPDRIARVIAQLGANIVGLQEVTAHAGLDRDSDQLARIARTSGFAFVRGPTLQRPDGHQGNGLLTRLPVRNARLIDLSLPGREPRGAIDAELEYAGTRLRVVVTHFGLSPAERSLQCDRLLDRLAPASDFDLSILIGDFNEWWAPAPLLSRLHHCFGHTRGVRTYPSPAPILALDRIWVRPAEAVVEIRAHRSALARRASDHLPVRAILEVSAESLSGERVHPTHAPNVPSEDEEPAGAA